MRGTPTCADCGATMEKWVDAWRCPWSKATARDIHTSGMVFNCGKPYKEKHSEIMAPITGRSVA